MGTGQGNFTNSKTSLFFPRRELIFCTRAMATFAVDKERLLQAYKDNDARDTDKFNSYLIEAVGGMENILTLILSSDDITLNDDQLMSLHEIIYAQNKIKPEHTDIVNIENGDNHPKWSYTFETNNTYLHSLFGQDKGQSIYKFIYSKKCWIPLLLLVLFGWLWKWLLPTNFPWIIYKYIAQQMATLLFLIWLIFISMSFNKKCFKLITQSFDFWIKIFYVLQLAVAVMVYLYYIPDSDRDIADWERTSIKPGSSAYNMRMLFLSLGYPVGILATVLVISIDAIPGKSMMKILVAIGLAIVTGYSSIVYIFYDRNVEIYLESLNYSISISSILSGSSQVLSVFMWKQAIMSIFRKDRCVLIKYSPYMEWQINDEVQSQPDVQMESIAVVIDANEADVLQEIVLSGYRMKSGGDDAEEIDLNDDFDEEP